MSNERYCTCQTVWELPCPVHADLTPPAKKWLAKIKAEAWDEGYEAGGFDNSAFGAVVEGYVDYDEYEDTTNPYRGK